MIAERPAPAALAARGPGWASSQRWVRVRLVGAAVLFTGCFGLLIHRAWELQVHEAQRMLQLAEEQYLHEVELPSRRGRILDRHGAELAASVEVDSVYANPRQIDASPGGSEAVIRALSKPLNLDRKELQRRLGSRRYFAWIKRHVLPDEARAVRALALPGVYLAREPHRYYPNRNLAGSILGWAGVDGRGLEGVELFYDKELRGTPSEVQGLRDALGRELLPSGIGDAAGRTGHDVSTTLDKFIQYRLEHALESGVARSRAKGGVAVALDPNSGEILAMASVPSLNPNDPATAKGVRNKAVTDPFEPGSTMKTFSITAAIEAGLVKPDEHWFCENGRYQIGPATIHDAEPIGNVTTTQVLAESSNICTAKMARRSGKERVDGMLRRFGFGALSGVDLPGERAGMLRPVKRWGEVELATISFGQGVTATPLQIVSGYATIANGGTWYKPHLLRRIVDERDRVIVEAQPEGRPVLSADVSRTMRTMLHAVVQKGGTAEKLAIPGYPAGGKTGTAQKVDPVTKRYSADKWASSFVGFAPLDDPRLVIFVMVDEPTGTHFGSAVAGPIWREVMVDALRYLNVPPTEEVVAQAPPARPAHGATPPAAARAAEPATNPATGERAEGLGDPTTPGEGVEPTLDPDGELARQLADGTAREIPDFTGLSMAEALDAARRAMLVLEVSGSGLAVAQEPRPGIAHLDTGTHPLRCRVQFAPPK